MAEVAALPRRRGSPLGAQTLWVGVALAAAANTVLPASGASNALILALLVGLGVAVYEPKVFLASFFGVTAALVLFALSGMHGINPRDTSAAASLGMVWAFLFASVRKPVRPFTTDRAIWVLLLVIIAFATTEFVTAVFDGRYTMCSAFPRASAPLRLDGFGFGGVPGCAYDPNNLGGVVGLLLTAVAASATFASVSAVALAATVATGSRILFVAVLLLLTRRSAVRFGILSAVVAVGIVALGRGDRLEMYKGRLDTLGSVEGSFRDRAEVMERSADLVGVVPPDDRRWVREERGMRYLSSYNGLLSVALRFGLPALGLLGASLLVVLLTKPPLRVPVVIWGIYNLTGEYLFNYFCTFALCVAVAHLKTKGDGT